MAGPGLVKSGQTGENKIILELPDNELDNAQRLHQGNFGCEGLLLSWINNSMPLQVDQSSKTGQGGKELIQLFLWPSP